MLLDEYTIDTYHAQPVIYWVCFLTFFKINIYLYKSLLSDLFGFLFPFVSSSCNWQTIVKCLDFL